MLLTLIVFFVTLGVLVVSHEMGHFLAAKKFGIKVLEFGFGLPPKVWSKKIGETIWSLNLLPIGGFVRLLGEDEADPKIRDNARSFAVKPVTQRMAVVAAGVAMNLVLAWLLFYTILILQDFRIIYPTSKPVLTVADVQAGFPAEQAGVKPGERIILVDGQVLTQTEQAVEYIRQHKDQAIKLQVGDLDGNNSREVMVTPKAISEEESRIGIAFSPVPFKQYRTLPEKLFSGITYSWDLTRLTFTGLVGLAGDLGQRDFSKASQSVAGPVGLVGVTGSIVSLGSKAVIPYLWFMAVISLTLTIFNSLPFPALDGGRFIFLLYEFVFRRKPNASFERWVHMAGMICLLALMLLITYSDIQKLVL